MIEIDTNLLKVYQKRAKEFSEMLRNGSVGISITPVQDDTNPPPSNIIKWAKVRNW